MHLMRIRNRPYAVINGKDFAVYRWFDAGRAGPLFIQVAGRTPLHRDDLPTDDWLVAQTHAGTIRVTTAWRKQWFDRRLDATRKLAFAGASTAGAYYLLLRYLARRFGITLEDADLVARSGELAGRTGSYHLIDRVADAGLTDSHLLVLDLPPYLDTTHVTELLSDTTP
jgi:hypothetical protein